MLRFSHSPVTFSFISVELTIPMLSPPENSTRCHIFLSECRWMSEKCIFNKQKYHNPIIFLTEIINCAMANNSIKELLNQFTEQETNFSELENLCWGPFPDGLAEKFWHVGNVDVSLRLDKFVQNCIPALVREVAENIFLQLVQLKAPQHNFQPLERICEENQSLHQKPRIKTNKIGAGAGPLLAAVIPLAPVDAISVSLGVLGSPVAGQVIKFVSESRWKVQKRAKVMGYFHFTGPRR